MKKKRLLAVLLVIGIAVVIVPICLAIPIEWSIASGGNGHYYEIINVPGGIGWADAKQVSEDRTFLDINGYLATVTSAEENNFIKENLFPFCNGTGPWLGGYQPPNSPEPNGNWQWITGEPWFYTNWALGEPTNANAYEKEDFLMMYNLPSNPDHGKWNDGGTQPTETSYVVEYIPEPATILLLTLGGLVLRRKH